MKVFFAIVLAAVIGYILGSLNFSIIIVKIMKNEDIRTMGSRNAGLTNTYRCCGPACALLTLVGDISKGVLAVAMSRLFAGLLHAGLTPDNDTHYIGYIAGLCAILGHVFPVFYNFKGGKGVLVGVSAFIIINPKVSLALLLIFIAVMALTKYVSLSSLMATAYGPPAILLISWIVDDCSFGRSFIYMLLSIPMAGMIIWCHRSNIQRLKEGTESKFSFKVSNNK